MDSGVADALGVGGAGGAIAVVDSIADALNRGAGDVLADLGAEVISRIDQGGVEQIRVWTKKLRQATTCAEVFVDDDVPG